MSPTSNDRARSSGRAPHDTTGATQPPVGATHESAADDGNNRTRPAPKARNTTHGRPALIGPTSEATRRLVAESRARQGLKPYITDPHTIESLVLFLRNALDTLDSDPRGTGREDR